jgi:hypothetical protein
MQICTVGAALIHAAGGTDMTKPTGAYHNYVNMPHNEIHSYNKDITINELNRFAIYS